jgi:hypothetical protein
VTVLAAILIAVLAFALVGIALFALRSSGQSASQRVESGETQAPTRPTPLVNDFHVKGDTASVVFAVPLGDGEVGDHLTELLDANAVEYVRRKVTDGLPLDGVSHIAVSAMRAGTPELINTVDLQEVGELPDAAPVLRKDTSGAAHDPIAAVQQVGADTSVAAPSDRSDTLDPVADFIELSSPTEAHLRAIGVDTSSMTLKDLVIGLFRVSGYQVEVGRPGFSLSSVDTADLYWITLDGKGSLLVIVRHELGSYPELDDQVLAEFAVGCAQLNPSQAILVTDKFSPYSMYQRERRDKRLVFVTRERIQGFVDSFGLS